MVIIAVSAASGIDKIPTPLDEHREEIRLGGSDNALSTNTPSSVASMFLLPI